MTWDFPRINEMFWSLFDRDSSMVSGVICECARISVRAQFSAPRTASLTEHQVTLDKTLTTIQSRQERDKWAQMTTTLVQNWFSHLLPRERERMRGDYQQERASFSTKACWYGSWIWTGFMSGLNEWSPFLCGVDWGDRIPVLLERTQWERISLINEHRHASSTGHSAWLLCHPGQNASGSVRLPHLVLLCERRMRTQDCEYRGCSEPEEIWTSVQRRRHSSQQYIRQR